MELLNKSTPTALKFVQDEVESIINECIGSVVGNSLFTNEAAQEWARNIVDKCRTDLVNLCKPFKYIVNCTIAQKAGFGLYQSSSCYWDNSKDGSCMVKWENKHIYCIVAVFAIAI